MPLFRPVILRIFVSGLILKKMADDYLGRKMEEYLARTASGPRNRRPLATLGRLLPHIRLGGALPELHLPLPGTEPNAFIIICSTVAEDRYVDIDLGISAQSMLLQAVEIGLNGICIGAFDKEPIRREFGLDAEPLLILALGKGIEKIELTEIGSDGDRAYYRKNGTHYVPKVRLEDLLIG